MATAKQRAWRAKFAKLYGHKKSARRSRSSVARRSVMARRRSYHRRSGGLFGSKMIRHAAIGAAVAFVKKDNLLIGAAGGVAGGMLMKSDIGAAGGAFVAPMVAGVVSGGVAAGDAQVWY